MAFSHRRGLYTTKLLENLACGPERFTDRDYGMNMFLMAPHWPSIHLADASIETKDEWVRFYTDLFVRHETALLEAATSSETKEALTSKSISASLHLSRQTCDAQVVKDSDDDAQVVQESSDGAPRSDSKRDELKDRVCMDKIVSAWLSFPQYCSPRLPAAGNAALLKMMLAVRQY